MPINKLLFSDFNIKNTQPVLKNVEIKKEQKKEYNNNLLYGSLLALGAIAFAGVVIHNKIKSKTTNEMKKAIIYNADETIKYDKGYRNKIIKGLEDIFGIKKELKDVKSLMGKEEFQEIISTYPPESFFFHQDSFDFMRNVQIKRGIQNDFRQQLVDGDVFYVRDYDNYMKYIKKELPDDLREEYFKPLTEGKYRVCLLGTIDDKIIDSRQAAEKLLAQSVQYADKVAKKVNDGKPPFIIAIKDTSEVQREVIKILSENPEKYKNLKVILRSEYCDKLFINPFDKGLIEEEKIAGEKFQEGLKQLFKHFFVLQKEGKIEETTFFCLNDLTSSRTKEALQKGFRLFNDSDWEKVIKNPNRVRTRNKQKNTWEIYNSFLDLYIRPFYCDDLKNKDSVRKIEKTHFYNFLTSALKYSKKEILPQDIMERFFYQTSDDYIVPIIKQEKIAGYFEDSVNLKNVVKENVTTDYSEQTGIIFKYMSPQKLAQLMKNEKMHHEGDTNTNPLIFISNFKNKFEQKKVDNLIKEMISKIYEKGTKEICFAESMYERTVKVPSKYIFGDEICITDNLWAKIIR